MGSDMKAIEFILYVADQKRSTEFYSRLLELSPVLDVPGMTEFKLGAAVKLGLMPENGIANIISPPMPHPRNGSGIPRCELYLKVDHAGKYLERGLRLGGKEISSLQMRDWGDKAGYLSDLDGHVIAFAENEKVGK
jgi:hypothetical protein